MCEDGESLDEVAQALGMFVVPIVMQGKKGGWYLKNWARDALGSEGGRNGRSFKAKDIAVGGSRAILTEGSGGYM